MIIICVHVQNIIAREKALEIDDNFESTTYI